jgi:hypothetical protein
MSEDGVRKQITGPTRVWVIDYADWRKNNLEPCILLSKPKGTIYSPHGEIISGTFIPDKPKKQRKTA